MKIDEIAAERKNIKADLKNFDKATLYKYTSTLALQYNRSFAAIERAGLTDFSSLYAVRAGKKIPETRLHASKDMTKQQLLKIYDRALRALRPEMFYGSDKEVTHSLKIKDILSIKENIIDRLDMQKINPDLINWKDYWKIYDKIQETNPIDVITDSNQVQQRIKNIYVKNIMDKQDIDDLVQQVQEDIKNNPIEKIKTEEILEAEAEEERAKKRNVILSDF